MTYSADDSDTNSLNLPEFDLDDYYYIVKAGISPEEAIETAIEIIEGEDI